jgi:hypothetical protein
MNTNPCSEVALVPESATKKAEKIEKLDTKLIELYVLEKLGTPTDLYKLRVSRHTPTTARVDVFRRMTREVATEFYARRTWNAEMRTEISKSLRAMDATIFKTTTQITDSFYLRTTSDGQVLMASPEITRRYE